VSKPIPNRANGKTNTKTEQSHEEYNLKATLIKAQKLSSTTTIADMPKKLSCHTIKDFMYFCPNIDKIFLF
jgi:hypothetical protein